MKAILFQCVILVLAVDSAVSLRQEGAIMGFASPPMTLASRANPLRQVSRRGGAAAGMRMQFIAEDGRTSEEYIKDIFAAYDKQRKGYLTQAEYNQWLMDTKRGGRVIDNEFRWFKFVERTKGDPSKGVTEQGLVDLYNSKEMSMGAAFPILANSAALLSCLLACILLSIPYYLPDCPQKHEARMCRELPFLEYPAK
uniref:EF-hand domain-containing protein n=1 Tax=Hemiselmis andersenii TaxID=464988 RepID=A0A6U4W2U4_HEMAN|mmetsp:Transcript_6540/g.15088  ORF Transcript_6540/g.15088 Transcript_6540/m.15088 type:complete len:197 (-) Transcript_6540:111-701(-)|eukprot:CAMPEP_0172000506 /NCGR_PEP_ID=MMETSP1041-20130122/2347_1 /TAXON_ID=464988 /ORGANISM="Hemiselmis andersenii, Strain CCMP439" /LENGTH=196 /DNA_ID=CAMNT_0012654033 /DNA_START=29 /DNA_END=619 /DNA_ORIENTATION=+